MSNTCEVCKKNNLIEVFNLGKNPLCDDLIKISSKEKNSLHKIVILYCTNYFSCKINNIQFLCQS
jgi:hypothetical protein